MLEFQPEYAKETYHERGVEFLDDPTGRYEAIAEAAAELSDGKFGFARFSPHISFLVTAGLDVGKKHIPTSKFEIYSLADFCKDAVREVASLSTCLSVAKGTSNNLFKEFEAKFPDIYGDLDINRYDVFIQNLGRFAVAPINEVAMIGGGAMNKIRLEKYLGNIREEVDEATVLRRSIKNLALYSMIPQFTEDKFARKIITRNHDSYATTIVFELEQYGNEHKIDFTKGVKQQFMDLKRQQSGGCPARKISHKSVLRGNLVYETIDAALQTFIRPKARASYDKKYAFDEPHFGQY